MRSAECPGEGSLRYYGAACAGPIVQYTATVIERRLDQPTFHGIKLTAVIEVHNAVRNADHGIEFHAHITSFKQST